MAKVTLNNLTHPFRSPLFAEYRPDFLGKLLGLMFKTSLPADQSLLMAEEKESRVNTAIHMAFMNFDIGVIWLDSQWRVVDTRLARRWITLAMPKIAAKYTLEINPGRLSEFNYGDQIEIIKK